MSAFLLNPFVSFPAAADAPPEPAANHTTWWADDLALSDGAAVSSWSPRVDDLGFGAHTQATGSKQPVYDADGIGGKPSVNGDGVDDLLESSILSTALTQTVTRILVATFEATAGNNYLVGCVQNTTARCAIYEGNSNKWAIYSGTALSTGPVLSTAARLAVAVFDGTSSSLELDGTTELSGDAGTGGLGSSTMFGLGFTSVPAKGRIALHQIVDGTLTAGELTDLEDWVSDYYGITIS